MSDIKNMVCGEESNMSKKCVKPQIRFAGFEEDWEQRKLALFAEFLSGNGLNWNDISADGKQECILYGNLYTDYGMIVDTVIYKTNSKIQNPVYSEFGDVLIPASDTTSTGLARATSLEKSGILLGSDINIIRPKIGINGSCLSLAINANKKELVKLIKGSTVRHIHNSEIKNIEIYLPKLESEQFRLSSYFKNIEHLIVIHQSKYDKLVNIKKSMLEKMFPKNGSNVPEIRFKGFSGDWEWRKLEDLIDVCSGRDYKHLSEGDIPVYGTGGYMLSVSEALSYDKDAIGIGRKGTIDKPYILNAPFWTVDTLFYAIPREKVDLNFIFDIFQNIDWKKKDESTSVPSLSKTTINNIDILVPKYGEQQALGQLFYGIDKLITLHQYKLEKLKNMKKACMEKMFV